MLYEFEVAGFKSFNEKFIFSLNQAKEYTFNTEAITKNIVKTGVIYGVNGIGKSNLGLALFDIIFHTTQGFESNSSYVNNYLNLEKDREYAEFTYRFQFGDDCLEYNYKKRSLRELLYEELKINGTTLIKIDKFKENTMMCLLVGAETLKTDLSDTNIKSVITYINTNAALDPNDKNNQIFSKFINFVEKMLFFRSIEGIRYMGFESDARAISLDIIENGNLDDFEKFLNASGIGCKLCEIEKEDGTPTIAFDFGKKKLPFWVGASTGTKSLALFYYWMQRLIVESRTASLVFIDEFDSFYHHELSIAVVEKLKSIKSQVILTTHNVSVMSNEILRPDCYFVMSREKISPLYANTPKELREAHNLGKMYKAGSFNG
ncbi:AAA family ATPase [Acinetobacter soli]|uniref:AAA family ATPase n=1 Tax=Acinetobacter soli TaxID=487316 RepID=UPI000469653C|nr:ATP-binding protein [Acinetobacter soli]